MTHLCPDQKARGVPPALTVLTLYFFLSRPGQRPKTITIAASCAVPEPPPAAATKTSTNNKFGVRSMLTLDRNHLETHFCTPKNRHSYGLKCVPNGQIRAGKAQAKVRGEEHAAPNDKGNRAEPRSVKMANMIIRENYCNGTRIPSRTSAKHRTCLRAGFALETVAPVRAALTDAGLDFHARLRLAERSTGFTQ